MNTKHTILIGHRSTLLCEVLREALEHRQYHVVSYATTGADLQKKLLLFHPDILVVSNALEGASGIEIAEQQAQRKNASICLFMSKDAYEAQAVNKRLNVAAHVPTFVNMSEFFYALQEIVSNRKYVSPVIEKLLIQTPNQQGVSVMDATMLQILTPREVEIMQALANSDTTPQIANKLFISTATVNNHRANIMQKLDIKGRNQLLSIAIALKPYYNSAA